ncbi:MAG: alpha/beta hydrolase family protein [Sporolactobacillus sp.]
MALMTTTFISDTLDLQTAVNILMPDRITPDEEPATLYLLHGLSGDYSSWMLRTSLYRYADGRPFIIIMPSVDRSFYTDMAVGNRYWTYLTKELPDKLHQWLPLTGKRSRQFVAGLSMGGYGALKWGLNAPEQFGGIVSMSGAVDLEAALARSPEFLPAFSAIFGHPDTFKGSANDLYHLAQKASSDGGALPEILQFCGKADFLYEDNLRFKAALDDSRLPHRFFDKPDTGHEWAYWDECVQYTLSWIEQRLKVAK